MKILIILFTAVATAAQVPSGCSLTTPCIPIWTGTLPFTYIKCTLSGTNYICPALTSGQTQLFPQILPTISGKDITFTCNNLASIPPLVASTCPGKVTLTTTSIVGSTVFFGFIAPSSANPNGILHVGAPGNNPVTCATTCNIDNIVGPSANEYPIATAQPGSNFSAWVNLIYLWNGAPFTPALFAYAAPGINVNLVGNNYAVECFAR